MRHLIHFTGIFLIIGIFLIGCDAVVDTNSESVKPSIHDLNGLTSTNNSEEIVVVNEDNVGVDWFTDATVAGGQVLFVEDATSPYGGAVQLSTVDDNASKANIAHPVDPISLADVTKLSYWTYQIGGPGLAAVSYQIFVTFNDNTWTWLVYEPYWQNETGNPAPVEPNEWQHWENIVTDGLFWSSRNAGGLTAGAGGPPLYTLAEVVNLETGATVEAIALNIGTWNPNWVVLADGVQFNNKIYDFEPKTDPTTKDDCKNGGWQNYGFRNQGQCIAFVNTGRDSR